MVASILGEDLWLSFSHWSPALHPRARQLGHRPILRGLRLRKTRSKGGADEAPGEDEDIDDEELEDEEGEEPEEEDEDGAPANK